MEDRSKVIELQNIGSRLVEYPSGKFANVGCACGCGMYCYADISSYFGCSRENPRALAVG